MPMCMRHRKAIDTAPDSKVKAGIYGNLGALLIGAQGRLEDALECTKEATALGIEGNMQDSPLFAGFALNRMPALHALGSIHKIQPALLRCRKVCNHS